MSEAAKPIRVVAILGSVSPTSRTALAMAVVADQLRGRPDVAVDLINPALVDLPFPGSGRKTDDAAAVKALVEGADAVVLATPEYHGSYSAAIKLVIENLGYPSALADKPVAVMGVGGGDLGAVKATEHLRSVCAHIGAMVLPGTTSIAHVRDAFDADGNCIDEKVDRRLRRLADNLLEYLAGRA